MDSEDLDESAHPRKCVRKAYVNSKGLDEPAHPRKITRMAFGDSEVPDQPAHPRKGVRKVCMMAQTDCASAKMCSQGICILEKTSTRHTCTFVTR